MDPRSSKAQDFVAISRNLDEEVHKGRRLKMKWFQQYEWLLDEKKKLKEEMMNLCKEKLATAASEKSIDEEGRSCLPAPVTTSKEYGWLASKPKFHLEKYGSYRPQYPDPLSDVVYLSGSMPSLAPGKGFIW